VIFGEVLFITPCNVVHGTLSCQAFFRVFLGDVVEAVGFAGKSNTLIASRFVSTNW
jgi:hypothetical protein